MLLHAVKTSGLTKEQRKVAIDRLVSGLHEVQQGIKQHLSALHQSKENLVDGPMPKMIKLLQHLHARIDKEQDDPATKDLP